MGRMIDIDKVIEIQMSQKAKDKVIALDSNVAIIFEGNRNKWSLACLIVCAFRYGKGRHYTQCLTSMNFDDIVCQNFDIIPDEFLRQMICGIHDEFRLWEIIQEDKAKGIDGGFNHASPYYLEEFLEKLQEEYVKRGNKKIPRDVCC